jgi:Xaa-Pro aminopeptidase
VLRAEIDSAILRAGGLPANTIVAGGDQACDPHERGFGPLKANSLIILDIFPRAAKSGYFGDMTRTVVRGRANEAQRKLWQTVREGQELALRKMKPGVDGLDLHNEVKRYFTDRGFPTEVRDGRQVGFFHGTGHGLGLEIHEFPRFQKTVFKPGQVLTVEPGLYYPGVGGARIEDVAVVTKSGNRLLSRFEKRLEI